MRTLARSIANVDENRLPDDELTSFLNDAQDEMMENHRLRFGESLITTAFVEDTKTINPAPTNGIVIAPTRIWYTDSSGEQVDLKPLTWNQYVDAYGSAETATGGFGDPAHFTVYGEDENGNPTIWLGPIPDAGRTAYVAARIRFLPLEDDDDHNQLTDRAGLAVVYKALVLAAPFLENSERIPEWDAAYAPIMRRLDVSHGAARYAGMHKRGMREPG